LSEKTKQCREDLRVLLLWRLDKGQVERAALRAWLAGSVDIEWGSDGRPRDLRSAEEEADAAIDHLLQQGNCKVTGKTGQEKVRLVRPVYSLEKKLGRVRDIEEKARQEAAKVLQEGGPAGGAEMLPGSWEKQAVSEVGERVAHAVGQAVVEQLKHEPAPEVRTPEQEPAATEEPCARFVMIPVDRLRPNNWNPNLMTAEEEGQVREEVHRRKRTAHEVLARPLGEGDYQILDGEHNWAAAKEDGITEVRCEVVEADDLEAMRLTYVRNQHGTRDPLLTGRLLQRMLGLAGVAPDAAGNSQREFARQNNISEGTLRNYLLYARAAEVRKRYARETADDTIGKLSVAKIRTYLDLPEDKRDEWLDRGASGAEAHQILAQAGKKPKGRKGREESKQLAGAAPDGEADKPAVASQPDEGPCDQPPCEGEQARPGAGAQEDKPAAAAQSRETSGPAVAAGAAEPLSQVEQEVVDGVLKSYKAGRALVRQKILGGLGAYPDAVAFFRRMIKSGG
jgi:ParB-like chromosome segregation protein Spo0J